MRIQVAGSVSKWTGRTAHARSSSSMDCPRRRRRSCGTPLRSTRALELPCGSVPKLLLLTWKPEQTSWVRGAMSTWRPGEISLHTAHGDNDTMIPTVNSYILAEHIPNARVRIFRDAGHGFLFQFPTEFAG